MVDFPAITGIGLVGHNPWVWLPTDSVSMDPDGVHMGEAVCTRQPFRTIDAYLDGRALHDPAAARHWAVKELCKPMID